MSRENDTEAVTNGPIEKMEWCRVGPQGTGFFWGSHGCTLGDHAGRDPHIHECQHAVFDTDGEILAVESCMKYDDRTDSVLVSDGTDFWHHWSSVGWWQGRTEDGTSLYWKNGEQT